MTMLDWPTERWTLVELARRQAERYGEREFMRFEDGTSVSFAELDRRSTRLAHGLAALGLRPGDRLLALLLNGPSFLPLLLTTNKVGAVFVTVNTELKGAFLEHQLRNSAPRVVAFSRKEVVETLERLTIPAHHFALKRIDGHQRGRGAGYGKRRLPMLSLRQLH